MEKTAPPGLDPRPDATFDEIEKLLDVAREIQWDKSPRPPAARDEPSERSKGDAVSDPTLDTVADERRLRVRAEVRRAEAFMMWCTRSLRTVRDGLDSAISAWEGEDRTGRE